MFYHLIHFLEWKTPLNALLQEVIIDDWALPLIVRLPNKLE